jgi:hypothetical protein
MKARHLPGGVHAIGGSKGNGGANQSQHVNLKKKDNEKFRKAVALLYSFRGCSILKNN